MPDAPADPLALARRWLDGYAAGPQADRHADPTVAIAYALVAIAEDVRTLLMSVAVLAAGNGPPAPPPAGLCDCAEPERRECVNWCSRCERPIAARAEGVTT